MEIITTVCWAIWLLIIVKLHALATATEIPNGLVQFTYTLQSELMERASTIHLYTSTIMTLFSKEPGLVHTDAGKYSKKR
jgi:hypothetical protein